MQGLWNRIEPEMETMEQAYDRIFLTNSEMFNCNDFKKFFTYKSQSLSNLKKNEKISIWNQLKKCSAIKSYFENIFPLKRVNKFYIRIINLEETIIHTISLRLYSL